MNYSSQNKNNILLLILVLFFSISATSQIYNPEGLNMPGDWNDWTNPPTNLVFAGSSQSTDGQVQLVTWGNPIYQTIFFVNETGGDIIPGSYSFKFTSGPLDNIWQNQWGDVAIELDEIQEYTYGVTGTNEPSHNGISVTNGHWYVLNWDNIGYENTSAIFMELDYEPIEILSVNQDPIMPTADDEVQVTVITSAFPSENIYIRYTSDNWVSSEISVCSFAGTSGAGVIPQYPNSTEIEYYVFSTTESNPPMNNIDLLTINYNNNNDSYYSYTVGDTVSCGNGVALIGTEPPFPQENLDLTITFNAELGNGGIAGYNDTVYAHTGVITSESTGSSDWKYVKTEWGENTPETMLTLIDDNLYEIHIPNIRDYYGVDASEAILQLAFVFRSKEPVNGEAYLEGKTVDNSDIFIDVYNDELNVKITYPTAGEPLVEPNTILPVCVAGLQSDSINLFIDDILLANQEGSSLFYQLNPGNFESGTHWLIAEGIDTENAVYDSVLIFIRGDVTIAELPEGVESGINYIDNQTVTLVLHDPAKLKQYAFVIGDFNNWMVSEDTYMNKTPEGEYYWITISGLVPSVEYAYQYYVDGDIKLADTYCDKILDPWNDKWIPEENYPNLKEYPFNLTTGNVSILETGKTPFNWVIEDFTPVAVHETQSDLIIYELLIRDFVDNRRIASVTDSLDYLKNLGVNAIELMPINEFEGNDSWGYNPSFYFATDKAYGTTEDYKRFIDECHQRDIAVIIDVVLNHSFSQSPMVQMYWDSQLNQPTAQNPWYNQTATHPLSPGSDFNHESQAVKDFTKRFFNYWVEEFKVDGFRLDLSKGFTQTYTGQDIGAWSQYDQSRINILTDYYNSIKETNPNTYVILEHLANNDEEVVLANTGMMLWGNISEQFNQNTMGWSDNSDFSWAYYNERGFTYPNLIPYMESHDEERLMYKNMMYGNSSGSYDITDSVTALNRISAIIPMYFMVPGPKMIWQFGELGYDYSINYCGDGTVNEECRTWSKPVKWDYWNDVNRQEIYQVLAGMAKLKTEQDAFQYGTYTKDLSGIVKRAWLSHNSLNVCVGGNYDVVNKTITPGFQHTGTWYNYFTGESIEVTNASGHSIDIEAGGYYVYTDQQLERPMVNLTIKVIRSETGNNVIGANVHLTDNGSRTTESNGEAVFVPTSNSSYSYKVSITGHDEVTGTVTITEDDLIQTVIIEGADYIGENEETNIAIYPNPANKQINIEVDADYILTITDLNGRKLTEKNIVTGNQNIDIGNLNNGIYILKFKKGNRNYYRKVIKN